MPMGGDSKHLGPCWKLRGWEHSSCWDTMDKVQRQLLGPLMWEIHVYNLIGTYHFDWFDQISEIPPVPFWLIPLIKYQSPESIITKTPYQVYMCDPTHRFKEDRIRFCSLTSSETETLHTNIRGI
jgi:hypothetical protein